ncbi:hypothetical protein BOX15_Mlig023010g3 [Macrostomum lignano]|uniref:Uncharacterized protein n=1 Tax=Macrostomum lignano TaxID=282301 RepID=A0A267DJ92_9PLAT|nr:hypothetical protein BOX15_Mlig023010g3 [Macrostomum lignano]
MAESVDGGVEVRSMQTVLGFEDEGNSTNDAYNVVVKDHGTKSGMKYDSVCITPAAELTYDELPEKTLQVLFTKEEQHDGLSYATIAVHETPVEYNESTTMSRIVHLRGSKRSTLDADGQKQEGVIASDSDTQNSIRYGRVPDSGGSSQQFGVMESNPEAHMGIRTGASSNDEQEGVFASDPEALKYIKFGPKPGAKASGASSNDEQEGIFASDPEALKYIKFGPKDGASSNDEQEGVFASDPEALKYIKFGPKPGAKVSGASSNDEQEGIFASDPEALKYIKFGPKPGTSSNDEPEGIFASDPEALKYIKFGPKPEAKATGASSNDKQEGIFASDPEDLKYFKLSPEPAKQEENPPKDQKVVEFGTEAQSATLEEGEFVAEATGVQLKDEKTYTVRVTGHDLPNGQQKKFISVRSADGSGGLTPQEVDNLDVKVETCVGEDGMVEKFVVVE